MEGRRWELDLVLQTEHLWRSHSGVAAKYKRPPVVNSLFTAGGLFAFVETNNEWSVTEDCIQGQSKYKEAFNPLCFLVRIAAYVKFIVKFIESVSCFLAQMLIKRMGYQHVRRIS